MPLPFDIVIQGGSVVLPNGVYAMDIGIRDGKIAALSEDVDAAGCPSIVDATGLVVMAGVVDSHVHFNEPGLGDWEGFLTGSASLAAGGITTFIDMPLNGVPPTIHVEALQQKLNAADGNCYVDYALWGGVVPGNNADLLPLKEAGVVGFKAFMSDPGGEGEDIFTRADDLTMMEAMHELAAAERVLALHAESEAITSELTRRKLSQGQYSPMDFIESRPVIAEVEAVSRALLYARQTGCPLHFVHISSSESIALIEEAKSQKVNVTVETCPHYLCLDSSDVLQLGAVAKCAPPLRSKPEQEQLWQDIIEGRIDMIASDHSPCPPSMKTSDNFFEIWGGISGAQSTLLLMLEEGHVQRKIPLHQLTRMLSLNPARRFGLHGRKGELAINLDADIVLINMNKSTILNEDELYYRHRQSPYVGKTFSCSITATWSRGKLIYHEDHGLVGQRSGVYVPYGAGVEVTQDA